MVVHLMQAILNVTRAIPFLSLFSKDPADGADRTFPAQPPRAYDPLHLPDRGFQVVVDDQVVVVPQFPDLVPGRREAPFDLTPGVPAAPGQPRPERLQSGGRMPIRTASGRAALTEAPPWTSISRTASIPFDTIASTASREVPYL